MVLAAINLGVLTILFFVIGMIKPRWALFFLNKSGRFTVMAITIVLVMISVTMYGEGLRREKLEKTGFTKIPQSTVPVPIPVPQQTPQTRDQPR